MNSNRYVILIATFALLLSGCMTHPPGPDPLRPGAAISIATNEAKHTDLDVDGNGAAVGKNFLVGSLGGVAVGAAGGIYVSAACGPFIMFCAPMFAVAGAGAGLIVGSIAGTVNGIITGLPSEKAKLFNAAVAKAIEEAELDRQLQAQFTQRTSVHWTIDTEATNRVSLQITTFRFEQIKDDNLKLVICTSTRAESGRRTRIWDVEFVSVPHHVDAWLSDDAALIHQELDAGMDQLTQEMVTALYQLGTTGSAPGARGGMWSGL